MQRVPILSYIDLASKMLGSRGRRPEEKSSQSSPTADIERSIIIWKDKIGVALFI